MNNIDNCKSDEFKFIWVIVDKDYNIIQAHHSVNTENADNFLSLLSLRHKKLFKEYMSKLESYIGQGYLKLKVRNRDMLIYASSSMIKGERYFLLQLLDIAHNQNLKTSYENNQLMQLSRSVAHDVNHILTVIINICDVLFLKHAQGDKTFTEISQIVGNAKRIEKLMAQLTDSAQGTQSNVISVNESINELEPLISKLVKDKKIQLTINHSKYQLMTKLSQIEFERVIINLIVNALAATLAEGNITIDLEQLIMDEKFNYAGCYVLPQDEKIKNGEYVLIKVSDTGTGIKAEILDKIFEESFSTKEEKIGTGLGLSIVYNIIKQAEGHIIVKTEERKGTTFMIFLKSYQPLINKTVSVHKTQTTKEQLEVV